MCNVLQQNNADYRPTYPPIHYANFPSNEQGVTFALYYAPLSGDLITTITGGRAYILSNYQAGKTGEAIQQGLIYNYVSWGSPSSLGVDKHKMTVYKIVQLLHN